LFTSYMYEEHFIASLLSSTFSGLLHEAFSINRLVTIPPRRFVPTLYKSLMFIAVLRTAHLNLLNPFYASTPTLFQIGSNIIVYSIPGSHKLSILLSA
jgi:hypothetical protein